jgi:hypothetical protein
VNSALEALGAMLDRLLQVGFDCPQGDPEPFGDFAVGQILYAGKDQHPPPSLGQFRDRTPEQVDLGAVLDHARSVGPVISNIEETVDLVDGQAAAFGPSAIDGDVECYAKQIGPRTPHRSDLVHAFEPEICFLKHVGGEIGGAELTRELPIKAAVIRKQQIPQSGYVGITHLAPHPNAIPAVP